MNRISKFFITLTFLMLSTFSTFGFNFTDSVNTSYQFKSYPKRVIALGPNINEIIYAIGGKDLLVARSDFDDFPPEIKKLPSVGNLFDVNIEKVVSLKPDVVIGSTHASPKVAEKLTSLGIPTVSLYNESLNGTYDIIKKAGELLNLTANATNLTEKMRSDLEVIRLNASVLKYHPKVYFAIQFGDSDYTANKSSFISEVIELAGGINVASNLSGWSISKEAIFKADPDVIVIGNDGHIDNANNVIKRFKTNPLYAKLRAVKNNNIYVVDGDTIFRQSVRLPIAAKEFLTIFSSYSPSL